MSKIAIVTDSSPYLPKEYLQQYNITPLPLLLLWGGETLQDGVDIQAGDFYRRLADSKVMPTTSQVPIPKMVETFSSLIEQDYSVFGIFLSSQLSGTFQAALQARDMLTVGKEKVEVMDSETASMALGFLSLKAARIAADGASLAECKAFIENARSSAGIYFVVDTLDFLHRGGRIGGAQWLLGTGLNLKPILAVLNGKVESVERIRTKRKAMDRLVEIIVDKCAGKSNIQLSTLHANAKVDAQDILDSASSKLAVTEKLFTDVSPVIGAHIGPGAVGLAYMFD